MATYNFLVGNPFGFTDSTSTGWPPGTSLPDYQIWDPYGGDSRKIPRRVTYEITTVGSTRILPNGVKIDKFQGYSSPVIYPRESWTWEERGGYGHTLDRYYGGGTGFSNKIVGEFINIYIVRMTPGDNGEVYAARARCETFSAENDPQYGAHYTVYTANFERMTDYTYVTYLSIAP
ncbi:hypothetical protein KC887_01170 [Candidatus Kaiserbacteria bacterium]|nr:hypothetical protein [Candidatus Kaiserbacteria bacterium]